MKKSVVIREQFAPLFETATDEQAGKLIKAMLAYQGGDDVQFDDPLMTAIFSMIKQGIDHDNAEYKVTCERRRQAALSRWDASASNSMQEHTSASNSIDCNASDADMDMDKDKDTKKKTSPTESKKKKRFVPPTEEEVVQYVQEKGIPIDAVKFYNHYASQDWRKSNGQKVTDWKRCLVTWQHNGKDSKAPPGKPKAEYHNRYNDFPQRDNDYQQIQDDWIRKSFGAPLPVAGRG